MSDELDMYIGVYISMYILICVNMLVYICIISGYIPFDLYCSEFWNLGFEQAIKSNYVGVRIKSLSEYSDHHIHMYMYIYVCF